MPKGEFIWQCDHCGKYSIAGVMAVTEGGVFCSDKCAQEHSSAARTSVPKTENPSSSLGAPATVADEAFERLAIDYLVADLGADVDDPDFPRWIERCTDLFRRYKSLAEKCSKPLGTVWPGEQTETIDEALNLLERKISAAEEILG